MASTAEEQQLEDHNNRSIQLSQDNRNAFPVNSNFHTVGCRLLKANHSVLAIEAFTRGAVETGCVQCISDYIAVHTRTRKEMIHLRLPWLLEGAIRGHMLCVSILITNCYNESEPASAYALVNYWLKIAQSSESKVNIFTKEIMRKDLKKIVGNDCVRCKKQKDLDEDVTLKQCGNCKYFFYCGKECQLSHWKERNHIGECKQLQILKEYNRPYAKRIHKAITRGDDPKNIPELQTLRTKLGLDRPKEEYFSVTTMTMTMTMTMTTTMMIMIVQIHMNILLQQVKEQSISDQRQKRLRRTNKRTRVRK
jgi:hypothetical protein